MSRAGNGRTRRQREVLFAYQHGRCYWCNDLMVMPCFVKGQRPPDNEATIDHLDSRLSRNRGQYLGEYRHVLACRKCNGERASKEVQDLANWERWVRSGRAPRQQPESVA